MSLLYPSLGIGQHLFCGWDIDPNIYVSMVSASPCGKYYEYNVDLAAGNALDVQKVSSDSHYGLLLSP